MSYSATNLDINPWIDLLAHEIHTLGCSKCKIDTGYHWKQPGSNCSPHIRGTPLTREHLFTSLMLSFWLSGQCPYFKFPHFFVQSCTAFDKVITTTIIQCFFLTVLKNFSQLLMQFISQSIQLWMSWLDVETYGKYSLLFFQFYLILSF